MEFVSPLHAVFHVFMATIGLLGIIYSTGDLMLFLSNPNYALHDKQTNAKDNPHWIWSITVNLCSLSLFVFQHTFLAMPMVKQMIDKLGLRDLQRTLYIILTAASLKILIQYWQYTTIYNLWKLNTNNNIIYGLFITVHALSWISIYIGNVCMDINELLGIKQIYYKLKGLPEPLTLKTYELKRLYVHMRHPGFLGFLIIFWIVPVMSLDRIVLASFLTFYMLICWKTDSSDYHYQKIQYNRKFENENYS